MRGTIRDADGPVPESTVTVAGTAITTTADGQGRFRFAKLAAGSATLDVRAIAHARTLQTVEVAMDEPTEVTVSLGPKVQTLEALDATAAPAATERLAGFERRRRGGAGQFMTEAEIARRHPVVVTDALRMALSLEVITKGLGFDSTEGSTLLKSRRGPMMGPNGEPRDCFFALYVDGQRRRDSSSIDNMSPSEIAGIEIHNATSAPVDIVGLQNGNECGAVLVWTKGGGGSP